MNPESCLREIHRGNTAQARWLDEDYEIFAESPRPPAYTLWRYAALPKKKAIHSDQKEKEKESNSAPTTITLYSHEPVLCAVTGLGVRGHWEAEDPILISDLDLHHLLLSCPQHPLHLLSGIWCSHIMGTIGKKLPSKSPSHSSSDEVTVACCSPVPR
ncbi:Uncharacterized protein Adt_00932 [Abeliophyllum distichum]|uniref:Uncharacterized protein n=1 Tax=Abeliophyllum distichum TaxID=126358 RepID=A0ABD1VRF4_9LAMI